MWKSTPLYLALLAGLAHPANAQFSFIDASAQRGLDFVLGSPVRPGSAVGDINRDGWPDLVMFGIDNGPTRIFRNNGAQILAGTSERWFEDISHQVLAPDAPPGSTGILVDLDNDGDLDLAYSRLHPDPATGELSANITSFHWLENRLSSVGRFVDNGSNDPALAFQAERATGVTAADCDLDGDLDIVFLHNGGNGLLGLGLGFYLRNDDGIFTDATASFAPALQDPNRYFTPALVDFSGDLLPDLHISVDFFRDVHLRNVGGNFLQDVSVAAGTTSTNADMGIAVGDVDNDGDMDIYSTNINIGVLYVNDGSGTFTDQSNARGVQSWGSDTTIGWGTAFADLDLDQDNDLLFVSYGPGKGHLYENDSDGIFDDRTTLNPVLNLRGHGLIPFDYDLDGDLDLFVMRQQMGRPSLYENLASDSGRHWLQVTLRGSASNSEGIGARIEATTQEGLTQVRHVMHGTSYRSALPAKVHFGLAEHDHVRRLVVRWPSGQVSELSGVPADQHLVIHE